MLVEAVQYIERTYGRLKSPCSPAVRVFGVGSLYKGEELLRNNALCSWNNSSSIQSLLVLFAAKACKFPIWLKPL